MAAKDSIVVFKAGDIVRNKNKISLHYGVVGPFQRLHPKWTFAAGLACDVKVAGGFGPYGCEDVIMSVADLEPVEKSKAQ